MNKILIIEDDLEINALLADFLKEKGYAVHCQYDGLHVLDFLNKEKIDLIILDIMLPYRSGDIILSDVRKKFTIPVIIISAKETTQNKIDLLRLGADDYISKPFSLREVIARVKAVLRRTVTTETERAPERLTYQSLVIDITKKKVSIDDEEVPLTKKEFEILLLLVQNKGRVFSREDILARIWSDEVYVLDRTIDVNITRLRKKIGIYGKRIVTRLGYGYCFEAE